MNIWLTCLVSAFFTPYLFAVDGFTQNGKPINLPIQQAAISSTTNDNSRFNLEISLTAPFPKDFSTIALKVGNEVIKFTSAFTSEAESLYSISAAVESKPTAIKVANYLKIATTLRKHPGYQLITSFRPESRTNQVNQPITIVMSITNAGTKDFRFMRGGRQRGSRDNQFAFTCERYGKMLPDTGNPTHHGGLAAYVTISPGETHTVKADLSKWFTFTKNGSYSLRGSYYLSILDQKQGNFIWEEVVADEFSITLE